MYLRKVTCRHSYVDGDKYLAPAHFFDAEGGMGCL